MYSTMNTNSKVNIGNTREQNEYQNSSEIHNWSVYVQQLFQRKEYPNART